MELGYLFIGLSAATHLVESTLIKVYNRKHDKGGFIFTAIVSLFSMLFFVGKDLLTDPTGFNFTLEILPLAIVGGILYCVASLLTYLALQIGPFVISMLLISYSLVFTTVYGIIFLNEEATVFTYIGFAIIAISLFLVRGDSKNEDKKFSLKWLIYILISVAGAGMLGVVQRINQLNAAAKYGDASMNMFDNEFMIICLAISAVTLFTVGFIKDGKDCLYILKNGTPYALTAGLSNGATNMLTLLTNSFIDISISGPTRAGVKTVLSFLVSRFIFKENFLPRQIIGVILGGIAVIFLNI